MFDHTWRRPSTRRAVVLLTVGFLALGASLTACNGTGPDDEAPIEGGTLRVATVGPIEVDPALAVDQSRAAIADLLYDPLVILDPATLAPTPELAEWEASERQRRFTFTLDDHARFGDGSRVTSADVVASWTHVVDPETASPLAELFAPIAGYEEARAGDGVLAGVSTQDDRTIVVELSAPLADFPTYLAHPGLGIVRAGSLDDPDGPVGSGPFRLASHDESAARLVPTEDHDVVLDALELIVVTDAQAAADAVEDGSADLAVLLGETAPPDGATVSSAAYLAVSYYGLNMAHPALADERFRAAIVLAIDASKVVDAGYGDAADPAVSVAPEPLPGVGPGTCDDRCGPDRGRATDLLDQVFGDATPSAITIDFDETEVQHAVAAEIERQLEDIGIPVELRPLPADDYDAFLVDGDPMLFRFGWVGDVASARAFLAPAFLPDAPENLVRLDAPDVAAALDEAARTGDDAARADRYHDAQEAILDAYAVVPIAQFLTRYAAAPFVRDLEITAFGSFSGEEIWRDDGDE